MQYISLSICDSITSCFEALENSIPTQSVNFQILNTQVYLVNEGYNVLRISHRLLKKGNLVSLIQTEFTSRIAVGPVVEPDGRSDFQDTGHSTSVARISSINQRFYIKLLTNKQDYFNQFQVEHVYNQSGTFSVKVEDQLSSAVAYESLNILVNEAGK